MARFGLPASRDQPGALTALLCGGRAPRRSIEVGEVSRLEYGRLCSASLSDQHKRRGACSALRSTWLCLLAIYPHSPTRFERWGGERTGRYPRALLSWLGRCLRVRVTWHVTVVRSRVTNSPTRCGARTTTRRVGSVVLCFGMLVVGLARSGLDRTPPSPHGVNGKHPNPGQVCMSPGVARRGNALRAQSAGANRARVPATIHGSLAATKASVHLGPSLQLSASRPKPCQRTTLVAAKRATRVVCEKPVVTQVEVITP